MSNEANSQTDQDSRHPLQRLVLRLRDPETHIEACNEAVAMLETLWGILVMLKREMDPHRTDPTKLELPTSAWDEAVRRATQNSAISGKEKI